MRVTLSTSHFGIDEIIMVAEHVTKDNIVKSVNLFGPYFNIDLVMVLLLLGIHQGKLVLFRNLHLIPVVAGTTLWTYTLLQLERIIPTNNSIRALL